MARHRRTANHAALAATILVAPTTALAVDNRPDRNGVGAILQSPDFGDSNVEAYLGPVTPGNSYQHQMTATSGISGTVASLVWYKFTVDQNTPDTGLIFDTFGTNNGSSGGGFVLGFNPGTELAIYDGQGRLVLKQDNVRSSINRANETNEPIDPAVLSAGMAIDPDADPPGPGLSDPLNQPDDPTEVPVTGHFLATCHIDDPGTSGANFVDHWRWRTNTRGVSQVAFLKNPESHPQHDPDHPNHDPDADWDQFPMLEPGEYFIAVTGNARFAGHGPDMERPNPSCNSNAFNPVDEGNPGTDEENPFGFTSFHPHSGLTVLNVRVAGDLNGDQQVTVDDIDLLSAEARALAANTVPGVPESAFDNEGDFRGELGLTAQEHTLDLTGNFRIDRADRHMLIVNVLGTAPGDFDLDGDVDAFDLGTWQTGFGATGDASYGQGDADGDGDVDAFDLGIWQTNFGTGAAAAVPEPGTFVLILTGAVISCYQGKKRSTQRRGDATLSTWSVD